MTEKYIEFNKIYIIESLNVKDIKTGTLLKNDVLRWKKFNENHPVKTKLYSPSKRKEFFQVLDLIKSICIKNKTYPIIHFEIHGSNDKKGLILNSGDMITWEELIIKLREINIIIANNLFFTMAVCYGAYLFKAVELELPAPFCGMIGSEEAITTDDLMIRYQEFYNELLNNLNITKAYKALKKANTNMHNTYRFIDSSQAFKIIYRNYFKENTSDEAIKERLIQVKKDEKLEFKNRQSERKYNRGFKKILLQTRQRYYSEHSETFFMIDKVPSHRTRFNVPKSYTTLIK
ncbi:hypothetical protein IMCC3317_37220 [Kordia antarctica]|uniref:Uncharacterized protein n=1 Tax=Kordia antarctica TaxID=1218801 RepID=A0A7L4ZPA8_9FLAO|nr:hypothetical protein [Kordia antarctica]QHI38331.1 hypothetical protein IMCC3317_37220 [Kordia antarctica]